MAYAERTDVPFDRSMQQILTLVRKHGADQVGQFEGNGQLALQFTLDGRMIRFRIPLADAQSKRSAEQVKRQRGRALLLVIKAKLESVETGIETIEQAFLANVVTSDGSTVHERIAGHLAIEYESGEPPAHGLLARPGAA